MDFELRKTFEELEKKDLKFPLIDEVKAFKNKCIANCVQEYAYKADVLIADVYLEHASFEEPLKLLLSIVKEVDPSIYQDIYLEIVDRILYIYITKKNYRLALMYSSIKEKYIQKNDQDIFNRYLLEKGYIYVQMEETDKAIECFKTVIANPTQDTLKYALNAITDLYIEKKNIILAEESLNKCLTLQDDDEGRVYCDYLLAKICILKENTSEALQILKHIFENEDINQMTLPMVIDYLELLYNLKMYDDMALSISKIALFINACDDLYIQKQFVKIKIKYLVASKNVQKLQEIIDEYEAIDKKIIENEKKIALELNDRENNENITKAVDDVITNLEKLVAVFNNNGSYSDMRELVMSFYRSLQASVYFEEGSFVLFNKPCSFETLPTKDILIYNYKSGRLYEKPLQSSSLINSLAEMVVNQNKPLGFDLKKNKLELIDLFYSTNYIDEQLNYVYAIPLNYQASTFGVMIFASGNNDLTDKKNSILFDFASKIFESTITSYYIRDMYQVTKEMYDRTVLVNNIGLIKYSDDDMYISNSLMITLKQRSNFIKRRTYLHYISHNDIDRYNKVSENDNYKISYKLNIGSLFVSVTENVETFYDSDHNKLFKFGTITIDADSIRTLIDGKTLLMNKLKELKAQANRLEFNFSFVRLRTIPGDYELIRQTFGTTPYYLSDSDAVVLLENESNITEINEKIQLIADEYTIIRYPRDNVSIDDLFLRSELMMNNGDRTYNELRYKESLKQSTTNELASVVLNNPTSKPQLRVLRYYNFYNGELWIEPILYFGFNANNKDLNNDNEDSFHDNLTEFKESKEIIELLNHENKIIYDIKLFRSIIDNNIKVNTLIFISAKSLKRIYDRGLLNDNAKNIYFILSDNINGDINNLIQVVSEKANIIVHSNIYKFISAYNLDARKIKGIYVDKVEQEDRERILRIASQYKLDIFTPRRINDSNKNIYASDEVDIVK